jgi:predicted nucleic acid-binding protein
MTEYVLDSSAVLRYLDGEAGGDRVRLILRACVSGRAGLLISAIQWGEIAGRLRVHLGAAEQVRILDSVLPSEAAIVPADGERAVRAANLRVDLKIAYADAFALELAMESPDRVLVTADYGFKPFAKLARIEFLPAK